MDKLRKAKSFTNLRQYLFVCVCFLLLCASQAISDVPNVFVLWHTDSPTRVSFNCNAVIQGNGQINDNEIECKSTTTFFSHVVEPDTFEQHQATETAVGEAKLWLKEQDTCMVTLYNGAPLSVIPPIHVELEIVETDPGLRGDTAQGGNKPARLITGATVKVPLFLNEGEVVKVDTRTGEYQGRVKD